MHQQSTTEVFVSRLIKTVPLALLVLLALASVTVLIIYTSGAIPYKVYVMHTGSMAPTIPVKSAIVVRENRFHVGQVVVFRENGYIVAHRLMSINPDGTINTKGDANRSLDPWHAPKSSIIGGVVAAPHGVGFFLVYVSHWPGITSIALLLIFLWLTWAVARDFEDSQTQPTTG
jgi:signal peptidase